MTTIQAAALADEASLDPSDSSTSPTSPAGAASATPAPAISGVATIVCAAGGGFVASMLGTFHAPGIGTTLAGLALVVTWLVVARVRDRKLGARERVVLAAMALLALVPSLRQSLWLHSYAAVAFGALVAVLPWIARAPSTHIGIVAGACAVVRGGAAACGGAVMLGSAELDATTARDRLKAPLVGIAVILPVAGLFLALFSQADAVFGDLVSSFFAQLGGTGIARVLLAVIVTWAIVGLAYVAHRSPLADDNDLVTTPQTLRPREVLWAVALLNALFALFLVVQVIQIAGFAHALASPGVTYSSVAREGFFQLLAVVALVFGVVLVASWLVPANHRAVRIALSCLLLLTAGVAASALLRMARYTDAYGLTELRFHSTAVMLWLVLMLGWTWRTAVAGAIFGDARGRERFLPGVVGSAVAAILLLSAINPDGMIARANLARGVRVDVAHLAALSDDALPTIGDATASASVAAVAAVPDADAVALKLCEVLDARASRAEQRLDEESALAWSLPLHRAALAGCR